MGVAGRGGDCGNRIPRQICSAALAGVDAFGFGDQPQSSSMAWNDLAVDNSGCCLRIYPRLSLSGMLNITGYLSHTFVGKRLPGNPTCWNFSALKIGILNPAIAILMIAAVVYATRKSQKNNPDRAKMLFPGLHRPAVLRILPT